MADHRAERVGDFFDVQREDAKPSPDLASGLSCYVPLHNIRYGITMIVMSKNQHITWSIASSAEVFC